ncbi:MAG: hypothetical protein KGM24_06105 [Elusimicrobia bacterium]|nr:hypothetical protein [Elusimicrobiota bacterium]
MRQERAPRRRRIEAASGRAGYTLVEVLLATLIACVMVTTVFSVSLTTRRDLSHNDRRLVANQIARTVTARLANYVSACCNGSGCDGTGGSPTCTLPGPNAANTTNRWSFTDTAHQIYDSCGGSAGTSGNCYALQSGIEHYITGTGIIPDYFGKAPYKAYVLYSLNYFSAGAAPSFSQSVSVHWAEPNDQ